MNYLCFQDSPNYLAHWGAAGVEDVVELLIQQLRGLRDAAIDDEDTAPIQVDGDQLLQECRGGGGDLAGLHHNAIAGGDGREDGGQREVEREVPGSQHQHHSVGLRVEVRSVEQSYRALRTLPMVTVGYYDDQTGERDVLLVLGPGSDVSPQTDHLILQEVDLTEAGLLVGLVQVALQSRQPPSLVFHQHPT